MVRTGLGQANSGLVPFGDKVPVTFELCSLIDHLDVDGSHPKRNKDAKLETIKKFLFKSKILLERAIGQFRHIVPVRLTIQEN